MWFFILQVLKSKDTKYRPNAIGNPIQYDERNSF